MKDKDLTTLHPKIDELTITKMTEGRNIVQWRSDEWEITKTVSLKTIKELTEQENLAEALTSPNPNTRELAEILYKFKEKVLNK